MENVVELMENVEVVEMLPEGAEVAAKGLSKGGKLGLVVLGAGAAVGVCVWAYKKIKKAKGNNDEHVIHDVEEEIEEEE